MDSSAGPTFSSNPELENGTNSPLPPSSSAPENKLHQYATPADGEEAMDEDIPATQQASPAKAKGKARGRVGPKNKAKVAKPPPVKTVTTRGRRQKIYDHLKAQAAHERMQELKSAYTTVTKFMRQPLQWIADKSIKKLVDDPKAHEEVPECAAVREVLYQRLRDTKKQADDALEMELALARRNFERNVESVNHGFRIRAAELREQISDGLYEDLFQRLDRLERLHDRGLPADLVDAPNNDYIYKQISQDEADHPGAYVEYRDGVEVPFNGRPISELMAKIFEVPQTQVNQKRKAQGQPEGQPASKTVATSKDDDATPDVPARHTGGLLSAVEALEDVPDSPAEAGSSAPTPPAEPADEHSPENVDRAGPSSLARTEAQELVLPRGASAPDEYGVRLISRRPTRLDYPNNRIMVPTLFEFEDHEIGFRDSTNCPQKGATKARRGKYLDKPNSNCFFLDRRIGAWDSSTAEPGEFDDEKLEKHKLHPALGIFLATSANEQEPATPPVSGWKPVVFTAPDQKVVHTSRSIPHSRNEQRIASVQRKMEFRRNLTDFVTQEGIAEADIAPDEEAIEESRRLELEKRGLRPDQVVRQSIAEEQLPEPLDYEREAMKMEEEKETEEENEKEERKEEEERGEETEEEKQEKEKEDEEESKKLSAAFTDVVEQLLRAASEADAEQEAAALVPVPVPFAMATATTMAPTMAPTMATMTAMPLQQPPPPQQSRPYDAIRDVFTDSTWSITSVPATTPGPRRQVDTSRLSMLADMATAPPAPPALPIPPAPLAPPPLPPVEALPRPNDFLRTALNPAPPQYAAGPLAPPPNQGAYQAMQPAALGRTPFSDTGSAKSLPALRPVRSLVSDAPLPPPPPPPPQPQPERQESPLGRVSMVTSNNGPYYPLAPNRPFHNAYTMQESGLSPMMPPQQQGPMPYQMSPPPFQNVPPMLGPGHGPGPGPGPIPVPMSMMQPQGPPGGGSGLLPPLAHSGQLPPNSGPSPTHSRSRSGGTSAPHLQQHQLPQMAPSSAANASAAKYRKLEPAPVPPHRLGYGGNSQDLRTVMFDYQSQIKDYSAVEAPPRHGPTNIRGWSHNTSMPKKNRANSATTAVSRGGDSNGALATVPPPTPGITATDDQGPS